MKYTLNAGEGEALTLAPPLNGEAIVKVDSQRMGVPFSMGTHTLPRGGIIQPHRHLARDYALFVHRGQGRLTVAGRSTTVVPGMAVWVPRQTWCEVRNTGTGALQLLWISTPPGVEQYLRELSRLGRSAEAATALSVAQRHGVEVRTEPTTAKGQAPTGGSRRPRHRRGRHGQGQTRAGQRPLDAGPPPSAGGPSLGVVTPAPAPASPPRQTPKAGRGGGPGSEARPGRGTTKWSRGQVRGAPPPSTTGSTAPAAPTPSPSPRPRTDARRPHRRRVKEVYMGGRWVRVTGEGPVIDSGHGQPEA